MRLVSQEQMLFHFRYGIFELVSSPLFSCRFTPLLPRNFIHTHDCFEVCYVKEGCGQFYEKGLSLAIRTGDLFLGKPYIPHEILLDGNDCLDIYFYTFSVSSQVGAYTCLEEETVLKDFLCTPQIICKRNETIAPYLAMLDSYSKLGGVYGKEKLFSLFIQETLLCLTGNSSLPINSLSREAMRIQHYIETNIANKITIPMLCKEAGLSERGLFYLFQQEFHTTPLHHINQTKINIAISYLKMRFPVSKIAELLGFREITAFSRIFKQYTGHSPRAYAKEMLLSSQNSHPETHLVLPSHLP